ncbi:hypothetical protein CBW53_00770 [Yersinia frederiksenii]|nr:hypothetical protein CBW53_00770 [Yersinia frederiksenii]
MLNLCSALNPHVLCTLRFLRAVRIQTDGNNDAYWDKLFILFVTGCVCFDSIRESIELERDNQQNPMGIKFA